MSWPTVALGEICEFRYGKSLKAAQRAGMGVPVYGSNGPVGQHEVALTRGRAVVVGRKGSFGEIHLSDGPCWPIDTTYYIDESATKCDLTWLSHALRQLRLTDLNRAAAVPGLNRDDAYRQRLLLPPLDDQRRIARVLEAADALRFKRDCAIATFEILVDSLFNGMFVSAGEHGWPEVMVSDLVNSTRGGIRTGPFGSQLLHSEFVDAGIAVLGIDNVVTNEFRWAKPRHITEAKYAALKRYTVNPGDVLITIMGTCGRAAMVPDDVPLAINTKHLCCITLDQRRCLPSFLHSYFLRHPLARSYLLDRAKGAIMSGLNMGIIKELPVKLPPLATQGEFARRTDRIEEAKRAGMQHRRHLEALFASLQDRAFSGAL